MASEPICPPSSVLGTSEYALTSIDASSSEVFVLVFHSRRPFGSPSVAENRDFLPSASSPVGNKDRIDSLGPHPDRELRMLRMFHEVGQAFREGAASLREVAKLLEARDMTGDHPDSVPCTLASISRECAHAKRSFGKRFHLSGDAPLFVSRGRGYSICGLSELGMLAWTMTQDFLIRQHIVTSRN